MTLPNILVVDSEEGFGLMLKEGLANSGHYNAECVHTGSDALQAVVEQSFDMVIVDMGLVDMSPPKLIQAVRNIKSDMRIMMIPLMGQTLPKKMESYNINGVLTKPFFVGDLPDLVEKAFGRSRPKPVAPPPVQAPPPPVSAPPSATAPSTPPPPRSRLPQSHCRKWWLYQKKPSGFYAPMKLK